jgi:alpha/beta hydrolase fold
MVADMLEDLLTFASHSPGSNHEISHPYFLSRWAEELEDSVIFSIDYALAPEDPFPEGSTDIWQVYQWIVNEFGPSNSQSPFDLFPKRERNRENYYFW